MLFSSVICKLLFVSGWVTVSKRVLVIRLSRNSTRELPVGQSRTSIRDGSDQAYQTMGPKHELRVSFPVSSHNILYVNIIEQLVKARTAEVDERKDEYFVTPIHFGLKHRNGEKLELKIRARETESGLEFWAKHELSHSDVSVCGEEIAELLSAAGHPTSANDLNIGETVTLAKSVSKRKIDKVNFEITTICVQHPGAVHRDWISVVVEGKKAENVQNFLATAVEADGVRAALRIIQEVVGVKPLVGGYPAFIRHVVGKATEEDAHEYSAAWGRLLSILRS